LSASFGTILLGGKSAYSGSLATLMMRWRSSSVSLLPGYLGALPKIGNTLWYVATVEDQWLVLLMV
jgi:hypothetical protein